MKKLILGTLISILTYGAQVEALWPFSSTAVEKAEEEAELKLAQGAQKIMDEEIASILDVFAVNAAAGSKTTMDSLMRQMRTLEEKTGVSIEDIAGYMSSQLPSLILDNQEKVLNFIRDNEKKLTDQFVELARKLKTESGEYLFETYDQALNAGKSLVDTLEKIVTNPEPSEAEKISQSWAARNKNLFIGAGISMGAIAALPILIVAGLAYMTAEGTAAPAPKKPAFSFGSLGS